MTTRRSVIGVLRIVAKKPNSKLMFTKLSVWKRGPFTNMNGNAILASFSSAQTIQLFFIKIK